MVAVVVPAARDVQAADVVAEIIRLVDVSKVYGSGDATVNAVDGVGKLGQR